MTKDDFHHIAGIYNKVASYSVTPLILEELDLPCDGILIDAGGGTGRVAAELCKFVRLTIVADVSMGMLRYANKKNLDCVNTPTEYLPIKSNSVDRIIMMDSFHHLENHKKTVFELFRILKKDGRITIIEPNIRKPVVWFISFAEKIFLMRSNFKSGKKIADFFSDLKVEVNIRYFQYNVVVSILKL